jgi:starvation-inducible DNA-binding protein
MKSTAKPETHQLGSPEAQGNESQNINPRSFQTRAPGSAEQRLAVIALLNQHVADTLDLRSHAKHAHWNVKGTTFRSLHKLFDEIAEHLGEQADTLAERATSLGGFVPGTLDQATHASRIQDYPMDIVDGLQHVSAMADRIGTLAQFTREAIDLCEEQHDVPTSDLFIDISLVLEKDLWELESYIQTEPRGRIDS